MEQHCGVNAARNICHRAAFMLDQAEKQTGERICSVTHGLTQIQCVEIAQDSRRAPVGACRYAYVLFERGVRSAVLPTAANVRK
jgi:hypothetical protein